MGRHKQFYCIDYRSMHTALHGLFIYESRELADKMYKHVTEKLHKLEVKTAKGEIDLDVSQILYSDVIYKLQLECVAHLEEIDFRKIKEKTEGKYERCYSELYKDKYKLVIVNILSVDLYI